MSSLSPLSSRTRSAGAWDGSSPYTTYSVVCGVSMSVFRGYGVQLTSTWETNRRSVVSGLVMDMAGM